MAGRVTDYESNYDEAVTPKTLHGIKEVKMLIIQCANNEGRTQVLMGIEVEPGDIRTFPEKTWDQLGKPSAWLMEQINEQYYGRQPATPTATPQVVKKAPPAPVKMDGAV